MQDEPPEKSDAQTRRERWIVGGLMGLGFVILAVLAMPVPWGGKERMIAGVVRFAAVQLNPDTGQRHLAMQAQLDDGRVVAVRSHSFVAPRANETVRLREVTDAGGLKAYFWDGPGR